MKKEEEQTDEKITGKDIISLILYIAVIVFLAYFVITFIGQRTMVSGSSMEPTLQNGDNLLVDKVSYRFRDPKRFEIIIFPYQYEKNTYYIKRIIGLPGETVWINQGKIYINGKILKENYGLATIEDPGDAATPIHLGKNEYFVMGDNRNNSTDSRFANVGLIKRKNIVGRAFFRIFPFHSFGLVKHE